MNTVRRRYAIIDDRRVHYRTCGEGPTLVMLHASPVSSQAFVDDYFPVFSEHFCCIAPDTPGNGFSDPLPNADDASIEDYVDALADFLDEIGVSDCILYGRHTGAEIATAFAQKHPRRIPFVYCDGYPVFRQSEIDALLPAYLPSYEPDTAGGFLPQLWFRYRDQHVFWSWHQQDSDHHADIDVPDLEFIHRGVLDFLLCGNDYIGPYAAALDYGAEDHWRNVVVPTCFAIRPGDSLYGVQARFTELPEGCWKQELPRETPAAVQQELAILRQNAKPKSAPHFADPALRAGRVTPLFIPTSSGELFLRYAKCIAPAKKPLLMAPHLPGGGSSLEALQSELAGDRDVLLIDTPGHGDSTLLEEHSVAAYSEAVLAATNELGISDFDVYGRRTGAALGEVLRSRLPSVQLIRDESADDASIDMERLSSRYQLDLTPSWEGGHLLKLWHHLRDEQIWRPWNERTVAARRQYSWRFDLPTHYKNFVDATKQIQNYAKGWGAYFDYRRDDNAQARRRAM